MKLNYLKFENFRGFRDYTAIFDGKNATIFGRTGSRKTTIYDGMCWLFFSKDSLDRPDSGRGAFNLRPLDKDNNVIKGLVVAVEGGLTLDDGTSIVLRKEQHETVVKKQIKGYTKRCWKDKVPKTITDFNAFIADIIPEKMFRLLTDLTYFNGKMDDKERRAVLMAMAGEIPAPSGFDELVGLCENRSIDDYKIVLSDEKKLHEKERNQINTRIDENEKSLGGLTETDTTKLEESRNAEKQAISDIEEKNKELYATEHTRQAKIESINNLKTDLIIREGILAKDTSGIQNLLTEKATLETGVLNKQNAIANAERLVTAKKADIDCAKTELEACLAKRQSVIKEYADAAVETKDTCYACGQKLQADKLAENESKRKENKAKIIERGNRIQFEVTAITKTISILETDLKVLNSSVKSATSIAKIAAQKATPECEALDKRIAAHETPAPEKDSEWLKISAMIKNAESELGESVSRIMEDNRKVLQDHNDKLTELNEALKSVDKVTKINNRIAELTNSENDLAQKIAELERLLADIQRYKATESKFIEAAVDDKFEHVKFKMFDTQLNGTIVDVCVTLLDGKPYKSLSTGEKMFVGIDEINALARHYKLNVPLFVDNSESLNYDKSASIPAVNPESQVIKLCSRYSDNNEVEIVIDEVA